LVIIVAQAKPHALIPDVYSQTKEGKMNRQKDPSQRKSASSYQQRQVRRNQIIIVIFSSLLIISLVLSLIVNL
jgi:hypothetical protein